MAGISAANNDGRWQYRMPPEGRTGNVQPKDVLTSKSSGEGDTQHLKLMRGEVHATARKRMP